MRLEILRLRTDFVIDNKKIERAIEEILEAIGEDKNREGLKETPQRVAKMFNEIFSGYGETADDLVKIFNEKYRSDEIIAVTDIPFCSMCEHHMMPFYGKVSIAYLPKDEKIIGISKFSRIINYFSKRLQVQERLTKQISDFLYEKLDPFGIIVIIEAEHMCMTMRGVQKPGSKTVTTIVRGAFAEDFTLQQTFLQMVKG